MDMTQWSHPHMVHITGHTLDRRGTQLVNLHFISS